jgi:hypothetical protein
MKKIYGHPTIPDLRLDSKDTEPAFTSFSITWGKHFTFDYSPNNLFYKDKSTILHIPVYRVYTERNLRPYKGRVEQIRDILRNNLFEMVLGRSLGPSLFIPFDTLARSVDLEHNLQNGGADHWLGFSGRYHSNANSDESYRTWVDWYMQQEESLHQLGLTVNSISVTDPIRRRALLEAKKKLGLT